MNPTFLQSASTVDVFDFVEITIRLHHPVNDPFRATLVTGAFGKPGEDARIVSGFCDTQTGSTYRIRFMPTASGLHNYSIKVEWPEGSAEYAGSFDAADAGRNGLLAVDPDHPYHFIWSGSHEHVFVSGTTTYFMLGCSDAVIAESIDRLAGKGINRIRVALNSCRVADAMAWKESVFPDENFTFQFGPWLAESPEAVGDPGYDVTRFDVAYWRKVERMLERARKHDMIVSTIFFIDGYRPGAYPFDMTKTSEHYGLDQNEVLYYQYAAARLAAYSNVEWCLTNEWHIFRPKTWVRAIGQRLSKADPYGHLMSVHGDEEFSFRVEKWATPWADFAALQAWDDEGGYDFMMENRRLQERSGRRMPQVNEEYCYESHNPEGQNYAIRGADGRRRIAWEISMAGCYQTTGESTAHGLGGWLNGRGDDSMTMLDLYAHMKSFFESIDWWRLEPRPDLAGGAMCLAEVGVRYVVYMPNGLTGEPCVDLAPGEYTRRYYNPRIGVFVDSTDETNDWVALWEIK